jgi:hypothetical protein
VAGAVAAVELVALIVFGAMQLAPSHPAAHTSVAKKTHVKPIVRRPAAVPSRPLRARVRVHVLVLNGNGVQGAAGREAARLRGKGYRIAGAANAARKDYAHSMVLYVPGWAGEGRRLAHDARIGIVAPVDGLRGAALRGSQAVVILGSP